MICPACLTFDMTATTEAVTQVGGTMLCAMHGVEALTMRQTSPARPPRFQLPPPVETSAFPARPDPLEQPTAES